MLPLIKVLSLVVRVFVRPVVARSKKIHMNRPNSKNEYMRRWFMFLGNWYNKQEMRINKSFLGIDSADDFFVKPLGEEMAVEKGVEFFYEVLIYGILIGFPLYELYVSSTEAHVKSQKLNNQLKAMEDGLARLSQVVETDNALLIQQKELNEHLTQQVISLQGMLDTNFEILKRITKQDQEQNSNETPSS